MEETDCNLDEIDKIIEDLRNAEEIDICENAGINYNVSQMVVYQM